MINAKFKIIFMKLFHFRIFLIISIIAVTGFALTFIPRRVADSPVRGAQISSAVWGGTIRITGDVIFLPWTTLKIEPGTRVLFEKQPDIEGTEWTEFADVYIKDHNDPTGKEGYQKSHYDITARIKAIGTKEKPIVFTSAQSVPEYADWDQLVLFRGSRLENVEVAYAHNGINVWQGNAVIRDSKVHDSLWSCIDIFSTSNIVESNEIYHCWHQAIGVKVAGQNSILANNVRDSQLGVNCENGANPAIERNNFAAAPINPECPRGGNNSAEERSADTLGGTYNGRIIYPAK